VVVPAKWKGAARELSFKVRAGAENGEEEEVVVVGGGGGCVPEDSLLMVCPDCLTKLG
jgi:hypothetical protein